MTKFYAMLIVLGCLLLGSSPLTGQDREIVQISEGYPLSTINPGTIKGAGHTCGKYFALLSVDLVGRGESRPMVYLEPAGIASHLVHQGNIITLLGNNKVPKVHFLATPHNTTVFVIQISVTEWKAARPCIPDPQPTGVV